MRKNLVRMMVLFGIVVIAASVTATYAFFTATDEKTGVVDMGRVDSEFVSGSQAEIKTASLGESETENAVKTLSATFEYKNNSTIDTFVRFSYTAEHKDAYGAEVLTDQSNDAILSVNMSVDGTPLNVEKVKLKNAAGYEKEFLIPITVSDANYYYRLAPGQNISGEATFEINAVGAETSRIVLSTETIQATEKALAAAEAYGWDPKMYN
jgi:predicted ribosomally synthesized peptide with SipW-like signal peptide